jgi:hypothetical protein
MDYPMAALPARMLLFLTLVLAAVAVSVARPRRDLPPVVDAVD